MMSLEKDSAATMVKMARYTPAQIERRFEAWQRMSEDLDSLKRSESFFLNEYVGEDKEKYLVEISKMIAQTELLLSTASEPKSIGQLNRENEKATFSAICMMINDLTRFFILDKMITKERIKSLAPMIISTYPSLTLEEIAVCFCNAKKGLYGEDYQRMDGSTIMKWLRLYVEDKQDRLANKQYTKEVQYKSGKDVGRSERSESLKVFLRKASAAVVLDRDLKGKK